MLSLLRAYEQGANGSSQTASLHQIAGALSPSVQELIILPTEKCNLRCSYCYEDFALGRMSEGTISGIENLISNRAPTLKQLRLSWFGGEPLAAKDVVLRIAKHAADVCTKYDVDLSGSFTTNGYLLDQRLASSLIDLKQDFFQITLDGMGRTHDDVRRRKDGGGSFARIWHNLLALQLLDKQFRVLLRIHVRRDNLENLQTLMGVLGEEFGSDPRFQLDFQHLRNLGGEGGKTVQDPVSRSEVRNMEKDLRALFHACSSSLIESKGIVSSGVGLEKMVPTSTQGCYICYAAKANSLLIRSSGRIGKCTVALNDERNDLGEIRPDGSIVIDNDKLQPWLRGIGSTREAELSCPLSGMV